MQALHTILVYPENVAAAKDALDKLIRKARRYGSDDISYSLDYCPRRQTIELRGEKFELDRECVAITVTGSAPRVGEFEFMARIERLPGGNVVDTVPGIDADPAWRDADGTCSHCGKARNRRLLFVVKSPEGVASIVGRSCLRDYMGTDAPEKILRRFSLFRELLEFGSDPDSFGGSGSRALPALAVLMWASLAIRLEGWTSSQKARELNERFYTDKYTATRATVSFLMFPPNGNTEICALWEEKTRQLTDADLEAAKDALSWVRASDDQSDYMHNLRTVLASDYLDPKRLGLVVSAMAGYLRSIGALGPKKSAEKAEKVAALVGKQAVQAEIISTRWDENAYGSTLKALYVVSTEAGEWRFWGTIPRAIRDTRGDKPLEGLRVQIKGTFTVKDDPSFAFVNRPSGKILD